MSAASVTNAVPVQGRPMGDPRIDAARAAPASAPAPQVAQPPQPDLRLNIVRDQESGVFVYKFVDPTSGQVVRQMPDQRLLELRRAAEYAAGRLISRKV
jgi:uncharacterized iron-regulated membrane protein